MDSRERMVEVIKTEYGFDAPSVFRAMLQVPREEFLPPNVKDSAYEDMALDIGFGQTISQPYTVTFMTNLLGLTGDEKVLEIGTGSGYQAAILSRLSKEVYSVERIPELASSAKTNLKRLGYKNVFVRDASGEFGWKEKSPFDAILVTAGMEDVPKELFAQLKDGGVLIAPIGKSFDKEMIKFTKKGKKIEKEKYGVFNFVPFIESN